MHFLPSPGYQRSLCDRTTPPAPRRLNVRPELRNLPIRTNSTTPPGLSLAIKPSRQSSPLSLPGLSFDTTVTFAQLANVATDLQKLVTERTAPPTRGAESYRAAYERTEPEEAALVTEFEKYLERGLDLEARKNTYQRIRRFLDNRDTELRIRGL